jgi:hypothetical protein
MAQAYEDQHLLSCQWIERDQHTLITGPTGTGRTWLGLCVRTRGGAQGLRDGLPPPSAFA